MQILSSSLRRKRTVEDIHLFYRLGVQTEMQQFAPQNNSTPFCESRYQNLAALAERCQFICGESTQFCLLSTNNCNNKSPGGIKCCLFTKREYATIVDKNPQAEAYFIEYEGRYALKEPHNVELKDKPSAFNLETLENSNNSFASFNNVEFLL